MPYITQLPIIIIVIQNSKNLNKKKIKNIIKNAKKYATKNHIKKIKNQSTYINSLLIY